MSDDNKPKNPPHPIIYIAVAVVGILLVMYLVFNTPSFLELEANASQATVTVTQTTSQFSTLTTTSASVNTETQIVTTYVTVTQQVPSNIAITGTAKSDGPGTTATNVLFTDAASNAVFQAPVQPNGNYAFSPGIPNQRTYLVQIVYSGTPLGGKCDVKLWTIDSMGTQITANLHC